MASKNQVTLTLAGDASKLEKAFDDVGASAKDMGSKVDRAGKDMESSFDRAAESTDTVDTRAMGFRDTVTGVQDSVLGFGRILRGDFGFEALVLAGMGVGDLASGFTNFLIPSFKSAVSWLGKTRVGMLAHAATTKVVSAATKVWTGIQAAFNFVMALNPITLVIIAIVGLVAVIVIAYKRSETFRRIVNAAFRGVLSVARSVWNWLRRTFPRIFSVIAAPFRAGGRAAVAAVRGISRGASAVWNAVRRGFSRVRGWISAPFRAGARAATAAINGIRNFWNRNIAGRGFTFPSWLGGGSFRIPRIHTGGVVPGLPGQETLAILQGGERISPAGGSGGGVTVTVAAGGGGASAERALANLVLLLIRTGALQLSVREGRVVAGVA